MKLYFVLSSRKMLSPDKCRNFFVNLVIQLQINNIINFRKWPLDTEKLTNTTDSGFLIIELWPCIWSKSRSITNSVSIKYLTLHYIPLCGIAVFNYKWLHRIHKTFKETTNYTPKNCHIGDSYDNVVCIQKVAIYIFNNNFPKIST